MAEMIRDIISGARPNGLKFAPLIPAIQKEKDTDISYRLFYAGQDYGPKMG